MVNLKIDGKDVQIRTGATILEAAEQVGIRIPTLCFLKKVSPTGACRICVVEIEGADKPMTACNTVAVEGMNVTTQSDKLNAIRRQVVELLLVNHPLDCPVCDAGGECDLQNICYEFDVDRQPFAADDVNPPVIDRWPLIQQVPSRCVMCEKCVKVCHETVGSSALFVNDKGDRAFIDKHLELCEFCGNCVQVCPTGTMISKAFKFRARPWELSVKSSLCSGCASQCEIDIHVKNNQIYRVTSQDGNRNDGNLCIGGFFGYDYVHAPNRLTAPKIKEQGAQVEVDWDMAIKVVADKAEEVVKGAGGKACAGLTSGHLTNEENYLFQKFFRVALGSNNIDSEARFGALKVQQAFSKGLGLRGASNALDRIGESEAVLVFGSDPTAEAPAIDWQIEKACRIRDGKLVVAGLRKVKLSRHANTPIVYRPGSEVAVASALCKLILDKGLADNDFLQRYVANLDELKQSLATLDAAKLAAEAGVELALLEEAAEHLGAAASVAIVFGDDVIRSKGSEAKIQALGNLALVSGALHGDLGGLFPVAQKANTIGMLDMGCYPEALPGHQDYAASREVFEKAWKAELPLEGRDALGILAGIEAGEIRFLYLAGCNPLTSFPDAGRWKKALEKVEYLVVQDILEGELTRMADVVLPGAAAAEKTGSLTSLDNRVSCLSQAVPPAGRSEWDVLCALFKKLKPGMGAFSPRETLAEIKELVPLYSEVCSLGEGDCRACVKDAYRPADKGLQYVAVSSAAASSDALQLLVGTSMFQFGTATASGSNCRQVEAEAYVAISPADADKLGVQDGAAVELKGAQASLKLKVRVSAKLPAGVLFAPAQYPEAPVYSLVGEGNLAAVSLTKA